MWSLTFRYHNLQPDSPSKCLPSVILAIQTLFILKGTDPYLLYPKSVCCITASSGIFPTAPVEETEDIILTNMG